MVLLAPFFCPGFSRSVSLPQPGIDLLTAVRTTLTHQPDIHLLEKDVDSQTGQLRIEQGQFDTTLGASVGHSHENIPRSSLDVLLGVQEITDTTRYDIDLTRQLRSGVVIQPGASIRRIYTQEPNYPTENRARVDFIVTVPLFKSGGREVTEAGERAAEKALDMSLLQLRHQTSVSVLNTVKAFWRYLAARKELDQLTRSESRADRLVTDIRMLIELDERPAADIEQVLANLAEKNAARIAGMQTLFEARQQLGLAVGLPFDQIAVLPLPEGDFPVPDMTVMTDLMANSGNRLMSRSLSLRQDYLALQAHQAASEILLKAAQNGLLPQVDLAFRFGYAGLDEGSHLSNTLSAPGSDIPGVSVGAGLNYQWPFNNTTARGVLMQRKAAYEQSRIRSEELSRSICSAVVTALSDLTNSSQQLTRTQASVRLYQKAVENENMKFRMGISTLLDRITIENFLTSALLQEIAAQEKFSNAMIRLRHETGTLLARDEQGLSVGMPELTTLPPVNPGDP